MMLLSPLPRRLERPLDDRIGTTPARHSDDFPTPESPATSTNG
jgi:hypothetical protein